MKCFSLLLPLLAVGISNATAQPAESASVRLPAFISSGMVLQRGDTARVWGWGEAGKSVEVKFLKKSYVAQVDSLGQWQVAIPTTRRRMVGGPYTMQINELQLDDIYVGDVWLCSGQSNMDLHCARLVDLYKEEFDTDSNPKIHLIQFARTPIADGPQDDVSRFGGFYGWEDMTPAHVGHWSGISYFYAKEMYRATGVPQGIINSSMGGSDILAWCSEPVLSREAPMAMLDINRLRTPGYLRRNAEINRAIGQVYNKIYESEDPGIQERWMAVDYDDSKWETVHQYDPNIGQQNGRSWVGSLWLRKEFMVPDSLVGRDSLLRLGCLIDADVCYINGVKVGETGYQYPPRKYALKEGFLKRGRNVLCIRLKTNGNPQKFVQDKPYRVLFHGGSYIDLEGEYRMQRGLLMPYQPGVEGVNNGKAAALYNNTIHPLLPYKIAGILWYQGETNVGRHAEYARLLPAMINDWRNSFGQVPAVVFTLANFMQRHDDANYYGGWAELREAQRRGTLAMQDAALVTMTDLGEWNDIHPLNKKEAARRAALQMRRLRGEKQLISEGPVVESVRYKGNKAIVTFRVAKGDSLCIAPAREEHTSHGIVRTDGQRLQGFKVAGADGRYYWAEANIVPKQASATVQEIELSAPNVAAPQSVRYAWDDDPVATLYGSTGLPAAPFEIK
ncbi:MAG: hypothetical protein K6E86_06150 [Bacteroidales bacterium]|nr:hypothetical protein [Bacteroidales bacterium]